MDTLIFIPGHGCTREVFAAQLQALSSDYQCICIDLCAYDSIEKIISHILSTAPEKFYILGFSLGAAIALHVSQQAPERIKGLIHISLPYEGPPNVLVKDLKHVQTLLAEISLPDFIKLAYQKYFPTKKMDDPLYTIFSHMLTSTGKIHYLNEAQMLLRPWALLPQAHDHHGVLILGGASDHRALPHYHQTMAHRLKTATLHLLPNTGHFLTLEQPVLSSRIIQDWLCRQITTTAS